jgi:CheY-like chemotaxis protein
MDINLVRGIDGIQATKAIRKIKGYENIPIIATTAYVMDNEKKEFLTSGCTHYLSKQFNLSDIMNLINEVLA